MSEKQNKKTMPPQHQNHQPGIEAEMNPLPEYEDKNYTPSGKLKGKTAIVSGGDSGIGRAVSLLFAKEGANVAISYLEEDSDAEKTRSLIEEAGGKCLLIPGDIGEESIARDVVQKTVDEFGGLDILVNNAAEQHPQEKLEDISAEQLERTFKTNVFAFFHMTKAALAHLKEGSSIINTTSITAYEGNPQLLDYSSTKGAIAAFTYSLSQSLVKKGIRVNGVAPGPIWTPLIPSTFSAEKVGKFGGNTPMKRPGQPRELAPAYLYLASDDSSYVSGQVIHVNGGTIVNS
ncbi:SDR family oxidoreductase [Bacillus marinisedimentorum]|uniref:SDR family oxidoreductase n=1 Tax=Bacillus marinisedimentorum TaxID=1821260 RepID=UPI000871CD63|nr:SDR family oxidoreductase [Bacillus marinisedimentorum]